MDLEQNGGDVKGTLSPVICQMLGVSPCSLLGSGFISEFCDSRGESKEGTLRDSSASELETRTSDWGTEGRHVLVNNWGQVTQVNILDSGEKEYF